MNPGWRVAAAGTGINLALGVLYAWSIFKTAIEKDFGWPAERLNDPYALCCLVFSFAMILAGKTQDRIGPRWTAMMGGLLVASGLAWASQTSAYSAWILGFGLLAGVGIGFGYSSATPPALKWFPSSQTGKVAGVVVAGFGLAPLYIAPLTEALLRRGGVPFATAFYAGFFLLVVCGLACFLQNPPASPESATVAVTSVDLSLLPRQMLRQKEFYLLWVTYFIAAGSGLMVISSINGMAKKSMGDLAFLAVVVMALGNAGGRVVTGILSDRVGRKLTLLIITVLQALCMLLAVPVTGSDAGPVLLVGLATAIGFNYGANLCLFPAFSKDLYGLKYFGANYGILFTSWGLGGFVLSRVQQTLKASSGGFQSSFLLAAGLLGLAVITVLMLPGQKKMSLKN